MTNYTDVERDTMRTATFGALTLVSQADPGFFATFKESIAGAKALAKAPPELQELFKGGGLPTMPKGSPAEVERTVLAGLAASVSILQEKSPADLAGFRAVIVASCDQVAGASGGVKETETAMIRKVKDAVGA